MSLNNWINTNHTELINITGKITRNHPDTYELYQEVIYQLLKKPNKIEVLPDEQKKYYFIKVIKNNWNSSTSPFQYHRQKDLVRNIPYDQQQHESLPDSIYEENTPSIEWVYNELEKLDWFDRDLFKLWLELGTYTKVSQDTTIPLNSVGKYIKNIIEILNKEWINKK